MENTVIFKKVKDKYDIGQPIEFKYVMSESVEMSERDWVGLYRVEEADTGVRDGKTKESRDRGRELVTYVWVPALRGSFKGQTVCSSVYFEAGTLPTDKESTYCVRYVASTGDVCGESLPFHFVVSSMREEQDLVAITDGDLLIIKTKAEAMSDELDQWVDSRLPDELIKEFVVEKGEVDKLSDLDFEEDSSPEDLESDEDSLPEDNKENPKTDSKTIRDSKVEARLGCTDDEDEFDSFQASSVSEQEFSIGCTKAVSHFDDLSDLDLTPTAEQVHPLLTESCSSACSLADEMSQGEDRVNQAAEMVSQDEDRLRQGEDRVNQRKDSETQSVNFGGQDMSEQVLPCQRPDGFDEIILPKISVELHPKPSSKMHIEILEQKVLELEKLLEEERNTVHHLKTQDIHMRIIVEKLHSELKTEIENNSRLRQHLTDKAVTSLYEEPYVPSCSGLGLSSRLSLGGKEESSTNKDIPALLSSSLNPLICHQVEPYEKMSDIKHVSHTQEAIHKQPMTSVNHSEATQEQPTTSVNNSVSTPDQQSDSAAIGCEAAEDRCLICEAAGQDRAIDSSLGGAKSNSIVAKLRGIPLLLRHLKGGVNWLISDDECDETMEAVCLNNQSQDSTEGMVKEVLKIDSGSKMLGLSGDACPICDEVFSSVLSKSEISAHVDSHRGTYCPLCFTRFAVGQDRFNNPRVVNHGGQGHGSGLRLVECYTQTDE